ncbi:DUF3253 domain-containing protein [Belliella pelovolcani]|uniref:DUF3253 domain-containing protein n=1 Tax=Belliella pelovolcani TaxID=529505 RepID=A0A1N7LE37_9BACT|nr:DUF3253 domain-containing protein [Belliella pelovolcani]SIS72053.1 Protein of unknown function [Belliella pelovolcani]
MKYPIDIPILELAILEMGRMRKGKSFCPSEVVRWIFPEAWRNFMDEVYQEMMRLYQEGKIIVTQKGIPVDPFLNPKGPVRITVKSQT